MAEIIAFIGGCIFSILIMGACLWLSYRVLEYKENTELRREEKKIRVRTMTAPTGGVIKPKTIEQMENDKNEELKAFEEMLIDPSKE